MFITLVLIILLQTGKGADIGAAFGGGSSQTVFGSSGATPFLSKVTIGAAVAFMCTSIILTYFSGRVGTVKEHSVVTEQGLQETAPTPGVPPVRPEQQKEAPAGAPPTATEGTPALPASPPPGGQPPPETK